MKKIYISGKITGMPEEEAFALFEKAENKLKNGWIPVNPMKLAHNHDRTWENFMKIDLIHMLQCDAVYMLPNWKESRGANIEHDLALQLRMPVIYE